MIDTRSRQQRRAEDRSMQKRIALYEAKIRDAERRIEEAEARSARLDAVFMESYGHLLTPEMEQRNRAAVDACLRGEVADVCPGIRLFPAGADVSSIPEFTANTKRTDVGPEGVRLSLSGVHLIFTADAFKEVSPNGH